VVTTTLSSATNNPRPVVALTTTESAEVANPPARNCGLVLSKKGDFCPTALAGRDVRLFAEIAF
jgi:hypothetical protein